MMHKLFDYMYAMQYDPFTHSNNSDIINSRLFLLYHSCGIINVVADGLP